jgi:hypothetical protein
LHRSSRMRPDNLLSSGRRGLRYLVTGHRQSHGDRRRDWENRCRGAPKLHGCFCHLHLTGLTTPMGGKSVDMITRILFALARGFLVVAAGTTTRGLSGAAWEVIEIVMARNNLNVSDSHVLCIASLRLSLFAFFEHGQTESSRSLCVQFTTVPDGMSAAVASPSATRCVNVASWGRTQKLHFGEDNPLRRCHASRSFVVCRPLWVETSPESGIHGMTDWQANYDPALKSYKMTSGLSLDARFESTWILTCNKG